MENGELVDSADTNSIIFTLNTSVRSTFHRLRRLLYPLINMIDLLTNLVYHLVWILQVLIVAEVLLSRFDVIIKELILLLVHDLRPTVLFYTLVEFRLLLLPLLIEQSMRYVNQFILEFLFLPHSVALCCRLALLQRASLVAFRLFLVIVGGSFAEAERSFQALICDGLPDLIFVLIEGVDVVLDVRSERSQSP